jgi:flagellar hook-associated protein FlgK
MADSKFMDPSSIALRGLQQADTQLNTAAAAIASAGTASPDGASLDIVSLSEEMVALMSAQNSFAANVATLETADQVQKGLLDVTA